MTHRSRATELWLWERGEEEGGGEKIVSSQRGRRRKRGYASPEGIRVTNKQKIWHLIKRTDAAAAFVLPGAS